MRIAVTAASAFALAAFATPAFAQDASTFTGPRVQGIAGWDHVNGPDSNDAKDGVVYGGAAGYDFQLGHAVLGFEGEATGATTRERDTGLLTPGDGYRIKAGRDLYVGGRIGFTPGGGALIYAKGGYTNARVDTRYVSGTTVIDNAQNLDGWRAGAGVEFKLGGKLYASAEYRYSRYSDINGTNVGLDRHQVVGGIGLRF